MSFSSTDLKAYHPFKGKMYGKCEKNRENGGVEEEKDCERLIGSTERGTEREREGDRDS